MLTGSGTRSYRSNQDHRKSFLFQDRNDNLINNLQKHLPLLHRVHIGKQ